MNRKLADNVGQKFQHQVAPRVGRNGGREDEPYDLGGHTFQFMRTGGIGRNARTSRRRQLRCGTLPVMSLRMKSLVGEMQN
jgi:hypothetical protein